MDGSARRLVFTISVVLALSAGPGCSRKFFRERADCDVEGVITQKNRFPAWAVKNWHDTSGFYPIAEAMSVSEADDSLAAALGRIPSGLFVLTARRGERETAMLASWVQQCSFNPPLITAAIKKGRDILDWLIDGGTFVLNVLPEGAKSLVGHFGKGFELEEPAFEGVKLTRDRETAPVLQAAHAYLACRVETRVEAGDHVLIVGRIVAGEVLNAGHPTVHVRKNGLKY